MSEEDKAEARALALEVIRDYRDGAAPSPNRSRPSCSRR